MEINQPTRIERRHARAADRARLLLAAAAAVGVVGTAGGILQFRDYLGDVYKNSISYFQQQRDKYFSPSEQGNNGGIVVVPPNGEPVIFAVPTPNVDPANTYSTPQVSGSAQAPPQPDTKPLESRLEPPTAAPKIASPPQQTGGVDQNITYPQDKGVGGGSPKNSQEIGEIIRVAQGKTEPAQTLPYQPPNNIQSAPAVTVIPTTPQTGIQNPPAIPPTSTPSAQYSPPKVTPNPAENKAPPVAPAVALPPNNPYDYAKSLGLVLPNYFERVKYDNNSRQFIDELVSLPQQMRAIAIDSGLVAKLIADNQITASEVRSSKRTLEKYQEDIAIYTPWLNSVSEKDLARALALNLSNFMKADEKGELFGSFADGDLPAFLSADMFLANALKRMYESEVVFGKRWGGAIKPYASAALANIENYWKIHDIAWKVANDPNYTTTDGRSIDHNLRLGYFRAESVGATDKGLSAYEDMRLLLERGSSRAQAVLRLYARNLTSEGQTGSAEQVRVELTGIEALSIGISSYLFVLDGHDVPTIPLTPEDIKLLKSRSPDPLLILNINGEPHLPLQPTRLNTIRPGVSYFTMPDGGVGRKEIKLADFKPSY